MVEGDERDIKLIEMTMEKSKWNINFIKIIDGEGADLFFKRQEHVDMIFLDINLPGKNGKQVLGKLKQNKNYTTPLF